MSNKTYTISAIYTDNKQRYAPNGVGETVTEAVIDAIRQARADNKCSTQMLDVFAVFEGEHECRDITVTYSTERPKRVRCRAKHERPFTVAHETGAFHVEALNAIEAELMYDEGKVSGVFRGHLTNLAHEINWCAVHWAVNMNAAA